MPPEGYNLLAQLPVVGIFMLYMLYTRKLEAQERADRDEAWRNSLEANREAVGKVLDGLAAAVEKLAESNKESAAQLARNQERMHRMLGKIAALNLVQLGSADDTEKARQIIRDLLEE